MCAERVGPDIVQLYCVLVRPIKKWFNENGVLHKALTSTPLNILEIGNSV